jgi:hypothetical protein
LGNARFEDDGFHGAEIHTGVFVRAVRIGGDYGIGAQAAETNSHFGIITS